MPKRPRDPNQLAKMVVEIATEGLDDPVSAAKRNPHVRGRAGGVKGAAVRAAKLSEEQRKSIAVKAAEARWYGKAKSNGPSRSKVSQGDLHRQSRLRPRP